MCISIYLCVYIHTYTYMCVYRYLSTVYVLGGYIYVFYILYICIYHIHIPFYLIKSRLGFYQISSLSNEFNLKAH